MAFLKNYMNHLGNSNIMQILPDKKKWVNAAVHFIKPA